MSYIKTYEEMMADTREKVIIDVRDYHEFIQSSHPHAKNIPWPEFMNHLDTIPQNKPVYLLCYSGKHSIEICENLTPSGYEIYSIKDGIYSYYKYMIEHNLSDETAREEKCKEIERSIIKKFRHALWSPFTKAINTYELIQEGDKIAVCISGGKDSMLMAKLFQELLRHGNKKFEVVYLVMNPGYNDINYTTILNNAKLMQLPIEVFQSEIFDIVAEESGSPCYLCARMRRGTLYHKAQELGCNKIALGHHYDDVIETILMGMLYGAQVQTMMPKLHSTNFKGMELIRPLYLIREQDIKNWAQYNDLRFINCACRLTESCASCGGTDKGSKRGEIKQLIAKLHETNPFVEANIFKSVENVHTNAIIGFKSADGTKHHFLDTYHQQL